MTFSFQLLLLGLMVAVLTAGAYYALSRSGLLDIDAAIKRQVASSLHGIQLPEDVFVAEVGAARQSLHVFRVPFGGLVLPEPLVMVAVVTMVVGTGRPPELRTNDEPEVAVLASLVQLPA